MEAMSVERWLVVTMIGFDLSVLALFNNSPGTLFESARVRAAKAAFTTPVVAAPWNDPASGDESLQAKLAAVQRIKSFVSPTRSEEHTSELQSLMRISYAVFCLTKKKFATTLPDTQ